MKKYGVWIKTIVFSLIGLLSILLVNSNIKIKKDVDYINISESANLYYNEQLVCVGDISKYRIQNAQYEDTIRIEKRIGKRRKLIHEYRSDGRFHQRRQGCAGH